MKVVGCITAILGSILCIVSLVLFGETIFRVTQARRVQTIPIELGKKLTTDLIHVDTSRFCMISVETKVRTEHTRMKHDDNGDHPVLEYAFPFRYTVFDSKGKVLYTEEVAFASGNGKIRSASNEHVTENGGSSTIKYDYEKFSPPLDGEIRVEAQLDPDEKYNATAEAPELFIYDNVSKHTKPLAIGFILLSIGGPFIGIGLILFFVGLFRK